MRSLCGVFRKIELKPLLFAMFILLPIYSFGASETSADPNSCSNEHSIATLDGVSNNLAETTNYYYSNGDYYPTYNTNVYFSFTPQVSGKVTLSEDDSTYWGGNSYDEVKFYVGSNCGSSDIVNDDSYARAHGPFTFDVVAGQTYHVHLIKDSYGYKRFSLKFSFEKAIASNQPDITLNPTSKNISPNTSAVDLNVVLSEAGNKGDITVKYKDCDGSNGSVIIPQGETTQSITAHTSSLNSDGDSCTVELTEATGSNGQEIGSYNSTSTITVASNEPDIAITPESKNIVVGVTSTTLTISLSEAPNMGNIDITYTDCDNTPQAITINKGESSKDITINTAGLSNEGDSCSVTINSAIGENGQKVGSYNSSSTIGAITVADEEIPTDEANPIEAVCGTFEDVLQTRNDPSKIVHKSGADARADDNPDCNLNTSDVDFGDWQHFYCNGSSEDMTATGKYGKSITVNYSNPPATASVSDTPSNSSKDETVTTSKTLEEDEYNKVEVGTGSYTNLNVTFSNLSKINELDFTKDNTVNFETPEPYNLEIGKVGIVNNGSGNTLKSVTTPKNIKVNTIDLPGGTTIDFEAKQTIKMDTLRFGRESSDVTLKAPYVQINSINQSNSNGGTSNLTIIADYVDIGTLDLDQEATITIKPYTPGKRILFRSKSISASSSSTMIVYSGNYYTQDFSIPGSSDVSSIRAGDENQTINLFLDGDFAPGNNPGINSDGNNGNFGDLPPANFMFFVNGDLVTGGGGTTFNATVYVEGKTDFGSPTYLKGALSSGGNIEIGNNSKFYYDQSLEDNRWGECIDYPNNFSCSIFDEPLVAYQTLHIGDSAPSNSVQVCKSDSISYGSLSLGSDTAIYCSENSCGGTSKCIKRNPPVNGLDYKVYKSVRLGVKEGTPNNPLINMDYGDFDGNYDLILTPSKSYYNRSDKKVMFLGDVKLTGNINKITLLPGDYYFHSLTFEGNNPAIELPQGGPVRIFIDGDLTSNGNGLSINANGEPSNLLIYTRGNINFKKESSLRELNGFVYSKNNIEIDTTYPNFIVNGGLTAEGDIYVTGDNPRFVRADAKNLGYGKCQMCYAGVEVGGTTMNFFNCGGFSMFKDIRVPIYSNNTYDNVTVDEAHKASMFSFEFMGTNNVLDQDGNYVADAIVHRSGWGAVAPGMDVSMFGGKAITYPLGDNYGPANEKDGYYQLHSSSMFSMGFNPCDWYESLVYVAHYDDGDKHYDVQLSQCAPKPKMPIERGGLFDAWDTFRGDINGDKIIESRDISTKIASREFNLTIATIKEAENRIDDTSDNYAQFRLYDVDSNNSLTNWQEFNSSRDGATHNFSFKVSKAVKNVAVQFKFCQEIGSNPPNLVTFENCENNVTYYEYNTTRSTDEFATRPDKFIFAKKPNSTIKAGDEFNVTIQALDGNGTPTQDYNESIDIALSNISPVLNYQDIKEACRPASAQLVKVSGSKFANGEANLTLKYNEIGDLNLTVLENDGSDFAKIDTKDTYFNAKANTSGDTTRGSIYREIEPVSTQVKLIADHFNVTDIKLHDSHEAGGIYFTYLASSGSNHNELDESMKASLDFNISAVNRDGNITLNYNKDCYANDIDVDIAYLINSKGASNTNPGGLSKLLYRVSNGNGSILDKNSTDLGNPLSIAIPKDKFENNGTLSLDIGMNFDRNYTTPINPFKLKVSDINVTDTTYTDVRDNNDTLASDKEATFYYARVKPSKELYEVVGKTSATTPVYVVAYSDDPTIMPSWLTMTDEYQWYRNTEHSTNGMEDGNLSLNVLNSVGSITLTNALMTQGADEGIVVGVNDDDIPITINISLSGTDSWLIYNPDADKEPVPFYRVKFTGVGSWAGEGATGHVVGGNVNKKKSRRIEW